MDAGGFSSVEGLLRLFDFCFGCSFHFFGLGKRCFCIVALPYQVGGCAHLFLGLVEDVSGSFDLLFNRFDGSVFPFESVKEFLLDFMLAGCRSRVGSLLLGFGMETIGIHLGVFDIRFGGRLF